MRAAPLLLAPLLVVGCGNGSMKEEGRASFAAKAPTAVAASGITLSKPQARLASEETPAASRMVVRNAQLTLRVEDVRKGEGAVGRVARSVGGLVEASQGSDLAGPNPNLSITVRVPEGRFEQSVADLEALGTRLEKTVGTEDVTAQAVDMDARLKSLRVQEDAYRAILGAARRISDVLEVQEKLTGVRTEIEQIVAQRRNLGDQAARSKIVVTLTQASRPSSPAAPTDWMAQTWGDATGTLRATGRAFASVGLWLVAMMPVWLPLGLVAAWGYRRSRPRAV